MKSTEVLKKELYINLKILALMMISLTNNKCVLQ